MAVNNKPAATEPNDIIERHIQMITGLLTTIQSRRNDLTRKLYELQKMDLEFEKLLQVSLIRLISTTDITSSNTKPNSKDSNAYQ